MTYTPRKSEETKTSKLLRKKLELLGCVVEKTHGNLYVQGQADFLVTRPDGWVIRIENKYTEVLSITQLQVITMLRPSQKGNLFWLRKKTKAKILICIASPNGYGLVRIPPKKKTASIKWMTLDETASLIVEY